MELYDRIKKDMVSEVKRKNINISGMLKVLISDVQRDPNKDYSDDKVIKVITSTITLLKDPHMMKLNKYNESCIKYLQQYLPIKISVDDINEYLNTIDFSKLRNKMQAVGMVMNNFPTGSVDGNDVKEILLNYN
jgi:uncharacterized protein YqeY